MSIEFKVRLEPRTKDGGFGHSKCDKCGSKTTGYLQLHIYGTFILLCVSCLEDGIEKVYNAMVKSYK